MPFFRRASLALLFGALAACAHQPSDIGPDAVAVLQPKSGSAAAGTVHFKQAGHKVYVTAVVTGLKPHSEHGFHVHEKGDCSAPDATTAGGHFNPSGHVHGHLTGHAAHPGDLPNLKADANGRAEARFEIDAITVGNGGYTDVVGRSIIVHRDADDYVSQPAGNAGPRVACAVIKKQ